MPPVLCVYPPKSPLCDQYAKFFEFADDNEWGVGESFTTVTPDGQARQGFYPLVRYTKGSVDRNRAAANQYYTLRSHGQSHEYARQVVLSLFPAEKDDLPQPDHIIERK